MKRTSESKKEPRAKNVKISYEVEKEIGDIEEKIGALLGKIYDRHNHSLELVESLNGLCVPGILHNGPNCDTISWDKLVGPKFDRNKGEHIESVNEYIETIVKFQPLTCYKILEHFAKAVEDTNVKLCRTYDLIRDMHRKLKTPLGIVPGRIRAKYTGHVLTDLSFRSLPIQNRMILFTAYLETIEVESCVGLQWGDISELYPIPDEANSLNRERSVFFYDDGTSEECYQMLHCIETSKQFLHQITGEAAGNIWHLSDNPNDPRNHPKYQEVLPIAQRDVVREDAKTYLNELEIDWKPTFPFELPL